MNGRAGQLLLFWRRDFLWNILLLLYPWAKAEIREFIFCLAMALKCYPLQPCGLLAIEAVLIGLTSPGFAASATRHSTMSNSVGRVFGERGLA